MLILKIERFAVCRSAVHGRMWIDGQHVCDTLENESCCLSEGSYPLSLGYVESEERKMIVIGKPPYAFPWEPQEEASAGPSAFFKPSCGPFALGGGSVSVGECHHLGFLLHCPHALDLLFMRVRLCLSRGGEAWLEVKG